MTMAQRAPDSRDHYFLFSSQSANMAGENRHPQIVVREWAQRVGAEIVCEVPQSIADCWQIWVRCNPGTEPCPFAWVPRDEYVEPPR